MYALYSEPVLIKRSDMTDHFVMVDIEPVRSGEGRPFTVGLSDAQAIQAKGEIGAYVLGCGFR